jgi:hypothetical protein
MELNVSNSISVGGYFAAAIGVLFLCIGLPVITFVAAFLGMFLGAVAMRVAMIESEPTQVATVDPSANRTTEVQAIKPE